jgi:hypothetical protein
VTPLYLQKLALTLPTGGGRSVGTVRSRTKAMEFDGHYPILPVLYSLELISNKAFAVAVTTIFLVQYPRFTTAQYGGYSHHFIQIDLCFLSGSVFLGSF